MSSAGCSGCLWYSQATRSYRKTKKNQMAMPTQVDMRQFVNRLAFFCREILMPVLEPTYFM
jgi:hypothetical protein